MPKIKHHGNVQKVAMEKSEKSILDFINKMTELPEEDAKLKDDLVHVWGSHKVKHRWFWLRGIARGTGLDKNTVTKAIERLIEKKLVWEEPYHKNARIFQLTFGKDWLPGWKWSYNRSLKQKRRFKVPIPRADRPKKTKIYQELTKKR